MIRGINHITLTVSDLDASLEFYRQLLGFQLHVTWDKGAYLTTGDTWFCLNVGTPSPAKDYSHIAFSIDENSMNELIEKLTEHGVSEWHENRSEGASLYILDPDGHQLELHVGSLKSRLEYLKKEPYEGLRWY